MGSTPIGSSGPPGPDTVGSAQIIDNSIAPADVSFNYAGSASKGGAATDLACAGCVGAGEVSFSFATLGFNVFTGTQHIASGNLSLEDSTGSTGLIMKAGGVYMHNFGVQNTFLGAGAGNLSMTGGQNVGFGDLALSGITSGNSNTALGEESLRDNTSGSNNTAAGMQALSSNNDGSGNAAFGAQALQSNTNGSGNTAGGWQALRCQHHGRQQHGDWFAGTRQQYDRRVEHRGGERSAGLECQRLEQCGDGW